MICKQCGHEVGEEAIFCEKCGTPVSGGYEDNVAGNAPEWAAPADPQGQSYYAGQGEWGYGQPPAPGYVQQGMGGPDVGTAPLVLGILSIVAAVVFGWSFIGPIAGIVLGILGIVQGKRALEQDPMSGRAKGGRVTGVIGLILSILALIITALFVFALGMAAVGAVNDPEAFIERMEEIAALDETGEAQKELDRLKEELEQLQRDQTGAGFVDMPVSLHQEAFTFSPYMWNCRFTSSQAC